MENKLFTAPFFNHFIQPSPLPIAKLKSLHGVLRGQLPPRNVSNPFVVCPLKRRENRGDTLCFIFMSFPIS